MTSYGKILYVVTLFHLLRLVLFWWTSVYVVLD